MAHYTHNQPGLGAKEHMTDLEAMEAIRDILHEFIPEARTVILKYLLAISEHDELG